MTTVFRLARGFSTAAILFVLTVAWGPAGSAPAQLIQRSAVEAYAGKPFGVGRVTVTRREGDLPQGDAAILLLEQSGRVHYPATQSGPVRKLLRNLLDTRLSVTIYFLFDGEEPLDLDLYAGGNYHVRVIPRNQPRMHARFMREWWREYGLAMQEFTRRGGFSPTVPNYLMVMLSRRLSLPEPEWLRDDSSFNEADPLDLFLGNEKLRASIELRRWRGANSTSAAPTVPLPADTPWTELEFAAPSVDVAVEPMAEHVPEEAFYVRFGSFGNFRWLREMADKWAADARNFVSKQGVEYDTTPHVERQLAVRESELSRWFGSAVISDIAVVGFDANVREGAAVGLLFQARNSFLLSQNLQQNRRDAQGGDPLATLTTETIGGQEVSFLNRPDNRLRSYYVADGQYHLVTNSRRLVERFLEAGRGERPLSKAPDYLEARRLLPVAREDAIFCYLSDALFRNLLSPKYRIEHTRRLKLLADAELLQLALLTSQAEGFSPSSVDDLVRTGFLPEGFGRDAGESSITWKDGVLMDSTRGALGTFAPIPDVELLEVTEVEAQEYARWSQYIEREWGRLAPLAFAVTRHPQPETGWEHVTLDAYATPLPEKQLKIAKTILGPPAADRIVPPAEDVVFGEAVLGGRLTRRGPYKGFFGIRSYDPSLEMSRLQLLFPTGWLRSLDGYLGFTPHTDLLSIVGGADYGPPGNGDSPLQLPFFEGWQRTEGQYTLLAPSRPTLGRVMPLLRQEPGERPGQVRLHVKDILESPLARGVNRLAYGRSLQVSQGNADLLNLLVTQLGAPREDALKIAERLVGARMQCPLGGEYRLEKIDGQPTRWTSSAVPLDWSSTFRVAPPEGYVFPVLSWMRGLEADLLLEGSVVSLHADAMLTPLSPPEPIPPGSTEPPANRVSRLSN